MTAVPNQSNPLNDTLAEQYRSYVYKLVRHVLTSMNIPKDFEDDLISAGMLGLVEAGEKFDPERGKDFRSYAFLRIRGAMIDALRQYSNLSRGSYQYAKVMDSMGLCRSELEEDLQSKHVGPNEKIAQVLEYAAQGALAYRVCLVSHEEEATENSDYGGDIERKIEKIEEDKALRQIISNLPEKERIIMHEYYFNDKSFAEIVAENPGLTKSWVSKLHVKALETIKNELKDLKIRQAAEGGFLSIIFALFLNLIWTIFHTYATSDFRIF